MKRFKLEKSQEEFYTSNSGLALLGLSIDRFTSIKQLLSQVSLLKRGIKSYLGFLSLGKRDFQAVTDKLEDKFFKESLAIKEIPPESTLGQRLDEHAERFLPVVNYCVDAEGMGRETGEGFYCRYNGLLEHCHITAL